MIGIKDDFNPSRIYVYSRGPDDSKGDCILYLIWEKDEATLRQITIFEDFQDFLSPNFKRLLSVEILADKNDFRKGFIGSTSRSEITLDVPQNNGRAKQITYYYDDIGLNIVHTKYPGNESISFAITNGVP